MSTRNSTVCVIGAGPAGLCAVKHCLDFGLSVQCYELRSRLGGRWSGLDAAGDTGEAWGSVGGGTQRLLSSQYVASFSDFPLPDDLTPSLFDRGRFLHDAAFREYLDRYASVFSLRPFIVCRMEVVNVQRLEEEEDEDGFRWSVTVRTRAGERSSKHRFVIVAMGSSGAPRMPEVPESFGCKVLHSSQLRSSDCSGRAVLVVGGGCSGAAAVESALRAGATKVTWCSSRREAPWPHIWLLDRSPGGRLAWDEWPFRLLRLLPLRCLTRLLSIAAVPAFQTNPNVLRPLDLTRDRVLVANVDIITAGLATDRLVISGAPFDCAVGHEVCVFATGFEPPRRFPLTAASSLLHRGVLALDRDSWGLAFLGGGLPLVELQARWLAHHWKLGRFQAESHRVALLAEAKAERPAGDPLRRAMCEAARMERLAADMGCALRLWRLLLSPRPSRRHAALAVLAGPWLPQQFRLTAAESVRTLVRVAKDVGGWRFLALRDCFEVAFHTAGGLLCYWLLRRFRRR